MNILDQLVVGSFEFARLQDGRLKGDETFRAVASGFYLFFIVVGLLSGFIVTISVIGETIYWRGELSDGASPNGPFLPWVLIVFAVPFYYVFRGGPKPLLRKLDRARDSADSVRRCVKTFKTAAAAGPIGLLSSAFVLVALQ